MVRIYKLWVLRFHNYGFCCTYFWTLDFWMHGRIVSLHSVCRLFGKSAIFRAMADVIGYSSSEHNSFPQNDLFCLYTSLLPASGKPNFLLCIRLSFCYTISPCTDSHYIAKHSLPYIQLHTLYFYSKKNVLHTKILLLLAPVTNKINANWY